jgi:flagellar biosynthesis/type III secretory pathway chaperone
MSADRTAAFEAALQDVHAALGALLEAAAQQRDALEARDRERLEAVSWLQESLTVRLQEAERRRISSMPAATLEQTIALLPAQPAQRVSGLLAAIRQSVLELREQHARNTTLLKRSLELTGQTLQFLQRLTLGQPATYTPAGAAGAGHSLIVDGRA